MKKTFKVHTYFLQWITMENMSSELLGDMTEQDRKRIDDVLTELNNMCTEANGYTITITAEG